VRASLPFGVIGFTLGLSYRFDSVLLNLFRGDAETGFYSAAYNLVFSAAVLSNALNTALYPSLSRQLARDRQLGSEVVQRTLKYLLILSLPIAVGGSLLSADLVRLLFTDSFLASAPALQILIWAVPLMFVSEFLGYLALVTGDERRVARALLASTAFGVALNLVLVPRLGFMAAAATTVATEAVLVGQYVWSMRPLMRSLAWQPTLGRPLLATALMGAVLIWIPALPVLVSVPIGALVYGCALLATGAIDRAELHFIRRLAAPRSSSPAQA
jgi:O-antigen/teichoic acid export membrane protein